MMTFEEAKAIVDAVECPPFTFRFERFDEGHERWFLQAQLWRPDSETGEFSTGSGGKYYVSPYSARGELVQKCLSAVLAYAEHEIRETFKFQNKRIFGPHISLDALMEVCDRKEYRE